MKTLTLQETIHIKHIATHSRARTARIVVACLFTASIALSDTLNSSVQYGIELERKQNSLATIRENTHSVESAFKQKVEGAEKNPKRDIVREDIATLIPASPRPLFQVPLAPCGTLTPQGTTGVVDRGFKDQVKEKSE